MQVEKRQVEVDLRNDPVLQWVRDGIIGREAILSTPLGSHRKRYFDQTASGLCFAPIEDKIREEVLPYMANTHTEASYTGRFMTSHYADAHHKVRRALNANEDDVVLFTGSGATGAINKLIACSLFPLQASNTCLQSQVQTCARVTRYITAR